MVNVALSWTVNDNNNTGGQDVERSTDGGSSWQVIGSGLNPTAMSYVDSTVERGEAYQYRIRRYTDDVSTLSATATARPQPLLRPQPLQSDFTQPSPFVAALLKPLRPEPAEFSFRGPDPLISSFLLTDEWQVDRERLRAESVDATAETLSLSLTVEASNIDTWREYDRAGDVTTQSGFAGSFRSFSRDGSPPVSIRAPFTRLRPFTPETEYQVTGYSERQIASNRFEVTLDFQRTSNRGEAFPELAQSGNDWIIGLDYGAISLSKKQVGRVDRQGSPAGATLTLPLRVSDDQAAALFDNLGYPDAVVERNIPDAKDKRVDETGGRQTISIDAPSGAAIESGDWFVTDWTLTFNSNSKPRVWAFDLEIAEDN